MSTISRTTLETVAMGQGYSRGQAKRVAARIVARPDWGAIQDVLTEQFVLPHSDPTAWDAIWTVLCEQLTTNHKVGAA